MVFILGFALIASGFASTSSPDQSIDQPDQEIEEPETTTGESDQKSILEQVQTENNTVTLTNTGFQPSTIAIEQGETVKWINNGSKPMWVGSDRHPTHTNYEGSSVSQHCENSEPVSDSVFDQCSTGERFSFTFEKTGEWEYHNHVAARQKGTVIVE